MYKNILIIGAARSGKTTLAKRFSKEKGYNLISIDDIVSGFEAYPELKIHHDGDAVDTAKRLAPFLIKLSNTLINFFTSIGCKPIVGSSKINIAFF